MSFTAVTIRAITAQELCNECTSSDEIHRVMVREEESQLEDVFAYGIHQLDDEVVTHRTPGGDSADSTGSADKDLTFDATAGQVRERLDAVGGDSDGEAETVGGREDKDLPDAVGGDSDGEVETVGGREDKDLPDAVGGDDDDEVETVGGREDKDLPDAVGGDDDDDDDDEEHEEDDLDEVDREAEDDDTDSERVANDLEVMVLNFGLAEVGVR
jgi:hypothetical protein